MLNLILSVCSTSLTKRTNGHNLKEIRTSRKDNGASTSGGICFNYQRCKSPKHEARPASRKRYQTIRELKGGKIRTPYGVPTAKDPDIQSIGAGSSIEVIKYPEQLLYYSRKLLDS
ncbi:hypothetical protein PanWU01x14_223420 [Parasponia andersonii]|uniref:Uncharacterized protein n=1 Tax=Parasponia andersonii TaxID=3476 RepID=A0A2P5BNN0_PARAD|nr:hypothetical protein PanWU01x14_223420 [Parasponia andersonii]